MSGRPGTDVFKGEIEMQVSKIAYEEIKVDIILLSAGDFFTLSEEETGWTPWY